MTTGPQTYNINVNMQKIEYVEEYLYLGQVITPSNTMQKEIGRRIANIVFKRNHEKIKTCQ